MKTKIVMNLIIPTELHKYSTKTECFFYRIRILYQRNHHGHGFHYPVIMITDKKNFKNQNKLNMENLMMKKSPLTNLKFQCTVRRVCSVHTDVCYIYS